MTRRFIGVRWWLGARFRARRRVSTAIVVSQFSSRSEDAFRVHAEQLAVQSATLAANDVAAADRAGTLQRRLATIAQHFDLDLYVYGAGGHSAREGAARGRTSRRHRPSSRRVARRDARTGAAR